MTKLRAIILGLSASALLCALAPLAGALPSSEVDVTYYKDATFETEIGYYFLGCNGQHARSGKTSRFMVRTSEPCHTTGSSEVACVVDGVPTYCPPSICNSGLYSCP